MTIIDDIVALQERHPGATTLVLSPRRHMELRQAAEVFVSSFVPLTDSDIAYFNGLRVERAPAASACAKCGAPPEPETCSYCGSPTDWIEVL